MNCTVKMLWAKMNPYRSSRPNHSGKYSGGSVTNR
jgi:hypothetical protein